MSRTQIKQSLIIEHGRVQNSGLSILKGKLYTFHAVCTHLTECTVKRCYTAPNNYFAHVNLFYSQL